MIKGIYLDLDVILDTRLATIFNHFGEEKMIEVLKSKKYYDRIEEEFVGIEKQEFSLAYAARNKRVLFSSMKTKIVELVVAMLYEELSNSVSVPSQTKPKVILNTYPYDLEEQEVNTIIRSLVYLTNKNFDIEAVTLPPSDVTPEFIMKNVNHMFFYNYGPWADAQSERLKKTKMQNVNVYTAGIYFDRKPNEQELEAIKDFNLHPFKLQEVVVSLFFNLKFLAPENYCAVIKKDSI
jgi:hypothetical protein